MIETAYVAAVHSLCPSVYAYAYDDGVGLSQCPAGTGYKVTFYCPDEAAKDEGKPPLGEPPTKFKPKFKPQPGA